MLILLFCVLVKSTSINLWTLILNLMMDRIALIYVVISHIFKTIVSSKIKSLCLEYATQNEKFEVCLTVCTFWYIAYY